MTKFEQDGEEFEFVRRGEVFEGEYFINNTGRFSQGGRGLMRSIFRKVAKRHVIGGVEFEETGDIRKPQKGDWYLSADGTSVGFWGNKLICPVFLRPILRPVGLKTPGTTYSDTERKQS